MNDDALSQHEILGLPMRSGTQHQIATWLVQQALRTDDGALVVSHVNANNFYRLHQHPDWRSRIISECVLILDGIGLQLGAYLTGNGWLPNLNGTDLFPAVMRQAERVGLRVFVLGSRSTVAERACEAMRREYGGLRILGSHSGYFQAHEEERIVSHIRECRPQLLLIGRGFLIQERFALQYRHVLGVPLIWNIGGLLDFVSGMTPRAPRLLRRARLEWLFRFLQNPRAMWHRNLVAAPWFMRQVLEQAVGKRPELPRQPAASLWAAAPPPFLRPPDERRTVAPQDNRDRTPDTTQDNRREHLHA